jgi:hypothetical protein
MLDTNGRKPFVTLTDAEELYWYGSSQNEIALVDTQNKTVIYGIDGLLKVIGFSFPVIVEIETYELL